MEYLFESMGLLLLATGNGKTIGRSKLQKMIYFADRYLDWDVGDYKMHYYGPYSRNVSTTLRYIREQLVTENVSDSGNYEYKLTADGTKFLNEFIEYEDNEKIQKTKEVFHELAEWGRPELEMAATIDFVQRYIPELKQDDLMNHVEEMKDDVTRDSILKTHDKWNKWRDAHGFNTHNSNLQCSYA